MARKASMGRQKIKIAKIQIKNHLQVTFSKRRSGLFKKASEISTLCGVDVAIIVFSPGGKVFSFGHPDVDSIIDRFFTPNPNPNPNLFFEARRNAGVREVNLELTRVLNELEDETKRGETLEQMRRVGRSQYWWEAPVDELALNEIEQLKESVEALKKNVGDELGSRNCHNNPVIEHFQSEARQMDCTVHHYNYGYILLKDIV